MILSPGQPDFWPLPQTPYETEALAFCRAWLSGQTEFTLHTSGSTGTPKPIQLTRAQMQASAHLTGQTLGLQSGDAALVCLNIRYVAGVMMLVRGLELGLPMTIIEPTGNPFINVNPSSNHFAFTALVPLQLQTILETGDSNTLAILNGMKAILVGGAATSPALEQALQVITAPVYATYGMTETVSHIALRRLNGPDASELFTALTGVDLGTDERGCLHITSAATNFERIQTNDVVDLIDSTHFRLLGRADRVINSGGVKVQPEQVEQLIQNVLATIDSGKTSKRLFVMGLPDERLGQRVVVVCERGGKGVEHGARGREHGARSAEQHDVEGLEGDVWSKIQEVIREKLGAYAVPKELIAVDQFIETPTGKVDQKATVAQIR
ncbi:AMP-binding protein [Spirosoma sp. HMF3257]|uniref:O-succinylbenzoic acid--CoA ligase n=1 Tax=Spirosoma telluris TaxID=2183553 RepID=A0A327NZ71_9BACT|nr:AMP-binding protein [Spirosoma telluris]RAI78178.1 O-succinylbenzoic acid--CoA ligase [Spirosoma telluris]